MTEPFINLSPEEVDVHIKKHISQLENKERLNTEEVLELRNLKRIITMKEGYVYCPQQAKNIGPGKFIKCWTCPNGHFLQCHWPFTCGSVYCKKNKEMGVF